MVMMLGQNQTVARPEYRQDKSRTWNSIFATLVQHKLKFTEVDEAETVCSGSQTASGGRTTALSGERFSKFTDVKLCQKYPLVEAVAPPECDLKVGMMELEILADKLEAALPNTNVRNNRQQRRRRK